MGAPFCSDISRPNPEKMSDTEAPVEVKKRGRPAKNKDASVEKEVSFVGESFTRGFTNLSKNVPLTPL